MADSWSYEEIMDFTGAIATAHNYYSSDTPNKTIDKNTSTVWQTRSVTGAWLKIQLPIPKKFARFKWYIANSTYYIPSFTLYGSNDDVNYTEILSGTDTNVTGWKTFNVTNDVEYLYYKWVLTAASTRIYIAEIQFINDIIVFYGKSDGRKIGIKFNLPLIGDVSGLTPTPVGGYQYVKKKLVYTEITTLNKDSESTSGRNTVDEKTNTYWYGTTAINWIMYKFIEPFKLNKLRLYMGSSYYIKTFKISGSNDGINFTQIGDILTGANSETYQWYEYILENENSYLYYRIDTLTTAYSRIYLYEVEMYEYKSVGNEQYFIVTVPERLFTQNPNGEIQNVVKTVKSVTRKEDTLDTIILQLDDFEKFDAVAGDISVFYGGGNIRGEGGPITSFTMVFTPQDLALKPDQNDQEYIEINISASSNLLRIYYTNVKSGNEFINISNITASGVLTNINDI